MSNMMTEEDDDIEIVEQEAPVEEQSAEQDETPEAEAEEEETDERLAESEDDHEQAVLEERSKSQKRREIRKRAKEHAERELRMLREQNEMLMQRMANLEGQSLSQNEAALDQRFAETIREIKQAETIMARATEAGNGDDVVAAMRIRDEAIARAQQLNAAKQQFAAAKQQVSQPQADPRVTSLAQEWLAANPWYDPQGRDEESAITNAIDNTLVREGYNPSSIEYWEELTHRVAARINGPEASESREKSSASAPRKKAPPMGNSREHAPVSTKKEVYVTAERKQAMIEAGVWDDPALRNRYLKAYREYDKSSAR